MTTQFLMDSLEGGDRYRDAIYGIDRRGQMVRNLIRQKREYPRETRHRYAGLLVDEDGNPAALPPSLREQEEHAEAVEFDYHLRRLRTPTPTFLGSFVEKQLSKIYKRPIRRDAPPAVRDWLENM